MKTSEVASHYARALFTLAQKKDRAAETLSELKTVVRILAEHPGFEQLLAHPSLEAAQKARLMSEALGKATSGLVIDFLKLLIKKHRLDELDNIVAQYYKLVETYQNIAEAKVVSAWPLASDLSEQLKTRLEEVTRHRIQLDTHVDPSLLAGAIITVKNKVLDISLKRRLEELKEKLKC